MSKVRQASAYISRSVALPLATLLCGLAIGFWLVPVADQSPERSGDESTVDDAAAYEERQPPRPMPPALIETYNLDPTVEEHHKRLLLAMRNDEASNVQIGLVIEKFGRDNGAHSARALREFLESRRSARYPQPRMQALLHLVSRNDVYAAHELGNVYPALSVQDRILAMQLLLAQGGRRHSQWLERGPNIPHRLKQLERQVRTRYGLVDSNER